MFPPQLLLALAADTTAANLDAWVPRRMAELNVPGIAVAFASRGKPGWTWTHGVTNVLTRQPVDEGTRWTLGALGSRGDLRTGRPRPDDSVASAHAAIAALLPPGLIILGVWAGIAWVALVPVSLLVRKRWRFGRWQEVLALVVAAPVAWIYLRRLGGPVLASYFTTAALAVSLIPFMLAALIWNRSRLMAFAPLAGMLALVWIVRAAVVPMPRSFGQTDPTMSVAEMHQLALVALNSDSLGRTALGLRPEGSRWVGRDTGRGAGALFMVIPDRNIGVVAASNAGGSAVLLRTVAEAVLR